MYRFIEISLEKPLWKSIFNAMFLLKEYTYDLPENKIAQFPAVPADSCKLLVCENNGEEPWKYVFVDKQFSDIASDLTENDVLFFNDTKVVKARVPLTNIRVVTHVWREVFLDQAEIFLLQKIDETHCECLVTLLKRTRPGMKIYIKNNNDLSNVVLEIIELNERGVILKFDWITVDQFFNSYWHLPLPPYIQTDQQKEQFYQTVFAKQSWSVAAPTASLHRTDELLQKVQANWTEVVYITLHVWLWTFKPIDTQDIRDYQIHSEEVWLNTIVFEQVAHYKQKGKNIIAVGTTVARTLETLPYLRTLLEDKTPFSQEVIAFWNSVVEWISTEKAREYVDTLISEKADHQNWEYWDKNTQKNLWNTASDRQQTIENHHFIHFSTRIYIYPGFPRKLVDSLITNFHVPWSSLMCLVGAAMGFENMKMAYEYALSGDYRFLSFGDAMRIKKLL